MNGGSTPPPAAPPRPDANDVGSDDTAIRSFTFAPRPPRNDDETTTVLPRPGRRPAAATPRPAPRSDEIDDYEDEADGRPIGQRAPLGPADRCVAAVVVLGLAIGYAVLGIGDENRGTVPPPAESTAGSVGPSPTTSASEPANRPAPC